MKEARRIEQLPPYLFASLDKKVSEARSRGVDVVSFGVGDPDRPTPSHIVEAASDALRDVTTHQYPSYYGMASFRASVAAFYERRFSVKLDPDTQVLPLIGSKEGIAHLATAYVDPGDSVLVPDPGYPVYETTAILAGGTAKPLPLTEENGFRPDLSAIDSNASESTKVLWLNFPSNPTGAVCEPEFFASAVKAVERNDLLLAHDAAYSEITFDGYVAPSVLSAPGALDHAIEFGSVSKTYNMTGWRVGWVAGAAEAIEALGRVKTNIDSGVFNALQMAAIAALEGPQDCVAEMIEVYRSRRDKVVDALNSAGWLISAPKGSIYVWARVPQGDTSASFCEFLLEKAGVVVAPGAGYGASGEGYVRFSLTVPDDRLELGLERIAAALKER